MRVRFLVSISGSVYSAAPGQSLPVDDAEAERLIAAGYAVADDPKAPAPPGRPTPQPEGGEQALSPAAANRETAVAKGPKAPKAAPKRAKRG